MAQPRRNPNSLRVPWHGSIDGALLRNLKTLAPKDKPFNDYIAELLDLGAQKRHGEYYPQLADFLRQQDLAS